MAMTRLEAQERANKIWTGLVLDITPRIFSGRQGEWIVDTRDGDRHALDGNGHTDCHPRCAQLEMKVFPGSSTHHPVVTVPVDTASNTIALRNQARDIRLAAQRLESWAKGQSLDHEITDNLVVMIQVRRQLGNIRGTLDSLFARFGKADR